MASKVNIYQNFVPLTCRVSNAGYLIIWLHLKTIKTSPSIP